MSRVTTAELRGMFTRLIRAATAVGIDASRWRFQTGSKTNGVSYTLTLAPYGRITGYGGDFLGTTAGEAYKALEHLALGFKLARDIPRMQQGIYGAKESAGVPLTMSSAERAYLARAVDVARSDDDARQVLPPNGRDVLLRRLGGRPTE